MKNFRFGADYYPDHWEQKTPEETEKRVRTDAELMQKAGLKVVRLAEFSWYKMEPEEGKYDFSWLEKAIEILAEYGIVSVLGTPTAAPPAWLVRKHPEVLPKGPDGIVRNFGGRHHDCQSNPVYREYAKRIVTQMALKFKDNPKVAGWQIDNEFGNSHWDLCMCDSCRASFQKWLKKRYGNVERLNRAWGTHFWSQGYNDFSEVFPPVKTPCGANPSQVLDWKRFHSDLICDFSLDQTRIIREICPKSQFITHNCMGFSDIVSYYDLSEQLDFVSHDLYPGGYWRGRDLTPSEIASELDGIRGVNGSNFWIMEQQCSVTGWENMGRAPKPGQIPLWAVDSVAHGADTVVFFRWRSCTAGTEQYWHGILPHSGIPGRAYDEIQKLTADMTPVMERMESALPEAKVAIVRSYEQGWAFQAQPNVPGLDYYGQLIKYHKAFYDRDIPVDFIGEDADLSAYDLVIAPLQYLSDEGLAEKYDAYVKAGGNLVLTMRSGVKDRDNICDDSRSLPGVFANLLGISITEYDPLGRARVPISFSTDCGKVSDFHSAPVEILAEKWADVVTCDTAEAVAGYSGEWYAGQPAITVNMRGLGTAWYVGTEPDENALNELISVIVEKTHILGKNSVKITHSVGVEVTSRVKNGVKWWFVLNHTGDVQQISVPESLEKEAGDFEDGKLKPYGYAVFSGPSDIEK